ncbi:unnamed protein product [Owenia fusiformis]|uniref:CUB domain-containing protein n=1 Tax=Owenia fusiformis TaxID=6347 RepID=A0A8S4NDH7_OWEFU|nr:unnamed protein product [Owenia fusiformis]
MDISKQLLRLLLVMSVQLRLGSATFTYPIRYMDVFCSTNEPVLYIVHEAGGGILRLTANDAYPPDVRCQLTLQADNGSHVSISMNKFDVGDKIIVGTHGLFCSDRLEIYDGKDEKAPVLSGETGLCGTAAKDGATYSSTGPALTLIFVSEVMRDIVDHIHSGFELTYTTFHRQPCGQGEFKCINGDCISSKLKCDALFNCRDLSDETSFAQCRGGGLSAVAIVGIVFAVLLPIILVLFLLGVCWERKVTDETIQTYTNPAYKVERAYDSYSLDRPRRRKMGITNAAYVISALDLNVTAEQRYSVASCGSGELSTFDRTFSGSEINRSKSLRDPSDKMNLSTMELGLGLRQRPDYLFAMVKPYTFDDDSLNDYIEKQKARTRTQDQTMSVRNNVIEQKDPSTRMLNQHHRYISGFTEANLAGVERKVNASLPNLHNVNSAEAERKQYSADFSSLKRGEPQHGSSPVIKCEDEQLTLVMENNYHTNACGTNHFRRFSKRQSI